MLAVFAGVVLATLVILGYLTFIWWLDRYEREPLWIVGLVFLWGGIGGTCLGVAVSLPLMVVAQALPLGIQPEVISSVVIAPFVEELTKGLIFIPLVLTHHFDNETDGLIYGAAAGLGFAAVENLLYYMTAMQGGAEAVFRLIVMRTLFTALVHCISSAILGMAIGYARHRAGAARWVIYPALGYVVAVINHAIWNGAAVYAGLPILAETTRGLILTAALGVVVIAAITMFLITQFSLDREHKVIQRFLEKEAELGTLPRRHAEIIPFWTRRRKSGWLPGGVPRDEYVRAATLLAFRHYQLEIAEGERQQQYQDDIKQYRAELRDMLEGVSPG
jgi:RsiW-degrading membrane proteinase PrsW (M82 family)